MTTVDRWDYGLIELLDQDDALGLRRDEAWRTALPVGQRRAVSLLASPLLPRYGYPVATRPE